MNQHQIPDKRKDIVLPAPQMVRCENDPSEEGIYVCLREDDTPIIISEKEKQKYQTNEFFILKDVYYDWMNIFKFINVENSSLNYYSNYVQENFSLTEQDIDNEMDKLLEFIIDQSNKLRQVMKDRLKQQQQFYKQEKQNHQDPFNQIENEYKSFRDKLAKLKISDFDSLKEFQDALNQLCKKATKPDDSYNNVVQAINNQKKDQPYFINRKIWNKTKEQIEKQIKQLGDFYISAYSFTNTQIANNDFIFEIFQRIKEDDDYKKKRSEQPQKLVHKLVDSLQAEIQQTVTNLAKRIHEKKINFLNYPTLLLLRTSTDQDIGFYHNPTRKGASLLFSLSKRIIFPVKNNGDLVLAKQEMEPIILQYGTDLVITKDFKNCTSILGGAFDLKESPTIGNLAEYLGNGVHFDIKYFELFTIRDQELTQPIQDIKFNLNASQGPPKNPPPGPNQPQFNPRATMQ